MWRTFKRDKSAASSSTGAAALSRLDSDISEVVQNNSEKTKGRAEIDVHDEGGGLRVRTPRASPQIAAQAKSSRPVRILRSVLIANRGECALRMLRTASQMGLEVYGIYEEDDVSHVRAFERNKELSCFRVGSYSDPNEIIELIQKQNVDLIWPGWGYLSEDASFAARISDETACVWCGPTASNIAALGGKHSARSLFLKEPSLAELVLPASPPVRNAREALEWLGGEQQRRSGFPYIVKPVGGGGGIGMTVVRSEEDLKMAADGEADDPIFGACAVADKFFGGDCGGCILEKFVERARHIEVQVFGDGKGNVIHLGERECSVQRRRQKVIEESPSTLFQDATSGAVDVRDRICEAAVLIGSRCRYLSAGTFEYLYDSSAGRAYFIEVNTRLQVEHVVTELVNGGIDLCEWMLLQAAEYHGCALAGNRGDGDGSPFSVCEGSSKFRWTPNGHSIQLRVNAEDVMQGFMGCGGTLDAFGLSSDEEGGAITVHASYEIGDVVSTNYDSLLAKVIVKAPTRFECIRKLEAMLQRTETCVSGVDSNLDVLEQFIRSRGFRDGAVCTQGPGSFEEFCLREYKRDGFVMTEAGLETTVQDTLGRERRGLWRIGVPPSGAIDNFSSKLVNTLVGNDENAAVLEFLTSREVSLRMLKPQSLACVGGAPDLRVSVVPGTGRGRREPQVLFTAFVVREGDTLVVERAKSAERRTGSGARGYIAFGGGGIDVPEYLGSRATFVKGSFGGFRGRKLRSGDCVRLFRESTGRLDLKPNGDGGAVGLPRSLWPDFPRAISKAAPDADIDWTIAVLSGPRNCPDFMTENDCRVFLESPFTVHHDSNRLGIRLDGPKPEWARPDGGEGGSHPSNIHDEEYAIGTVNFTGDMPIILAHDGPSLGGFVCPVTIASFDIWKIGQLQAGDRIRFKLITIEEAVDGLRRTRHIVQNLSAPPPPPPPVAADGSGAASASVVAAPVRMYSAVAFHRAASAGRPEMNVRLAGDRYVLCEYGPMQLDLAVRVRVHFLEMMILEADIDGILETAPGVRTLQIRYDMLRLPLSRLVECIASCDLGIDSRTDGAMKIQSRIISLPLAYNSRGCHEAMERYARSVRSDAPYVPDNIEYIRRNNGLADADASGDRDLVKEKILAASYMVLGLGDVYLGACCAVPVNPLHRLITTKMNPARLWTEEGTVGLGGAYMCIYPMHSPGGYQLVGRTLPIWNTYGKTHGNSDLAKFFSPSKPWMLEMFDQIRFFEVSESDLDVLREDFRRGKYCPKTYRVDFNIEDYHRILKENREQIAAYAEQQRRAMRVLNEEDRESLRRLAAGASAGHGPGGVDAEVSDGDAADPDAEVSRYIDSLGSPSGLHRVAADVTSKVFQVRVEEGQEVVAGKTVLIVLEAMKIEIPIVAERSGRVEKIFCCAGSMCERGQCLMLIEAGASADEPAPERADPDGGGGEGTIALEMSSLRRNYGAGSITPRLVVEQVFDSIAKRDAELGGGEDNFGSVWISLRSREEVLEYVRINFETEGGKFYSAGPGGGEMPELFGIPFAVKDNIDVASMQTTSACPGFAYVAGESAPCVQRLVDAGAILIGKVNLDQFATGLVGTRSPYGECFNAVHPAFISGGSSSGSAVAVALNFASFALGTDTAGSGRVPAALNGVFGLKPTYGRVSTRGSVHACRTLDCISVFAGSVAGCEQVLEVMGAFDPEEAYSRRAPIPQPRASVGVADESGRTFAFGVPTSVFFKDTPMNPDLSSKLREVFGEAVRAFESIGGRRVDVDFAPFQEAGRFVYGGPFVAERLASLRRLGVIAKDEQSRETGGILHPVTRTVIDSAKEFSAVDVYSTLYRIQELRRETAALFSGGDETNSGLTPIDFLLVPSIPTIYTRAEVREDPIATNSDNGYYTNFMNLLDMTGLAIPTGRRVELAFDSSGEMVAMPVGVTMAAPAWRESALMRIAERYGEAVGASGTS